MKKLLFTVFMGVSVFGFSGCSQSDSASQLELLADNYENISQEYLDAIDNSQTPKVAVTDFNRNGRLELFFSDCQGSGAFSYSSIYEVSEDYKSVDKLLDNEGEDLDQIGDFLSLDSYECYKKGDTYYYLVEDYTSAGWSCQGSSYYAYSFDGKIEAQELGGFGIQIKDPEDQKTFFVNLWGKDDQQFLDEEGFLNYFETLWEEYEKQPGCEVKWVPVVAENEPIKLLTESYEGFNTAATVEDVSLNYRLEGEDYNYVIEMQ